jgi:hypothetical protein
MNRISIIQSLIDKNSYTNYLEIGVRDGECFNAIECKFKVGVDPDKNSKATVFATSDEYFASIEQRYDIIFIDGLHHADQVEKDINNSLKTLNPGGIIVMHDCLPTSKRMQEIPLQEQQEWTGNTWMAYFKFRILRPDLKMHCVDTDWGIGLIQPGEQDTIALSILPSYEQFDANRKEWMKVISVEQFKEMYL